MNQIKVVTQIDVKLLEDDYRNQTFEQNLAFFRQHQPQWAKRIKKNINQHYKICLNPDQSLNIIDLQTGQTLFPDSRDKIDEYFEAQYRAMEINIYLHLEHFDDSIEAIEWRALNPLYYGLMEKLYDAGPLPALIDPVTHKLNLIKHPPGFLPLLRIYGCGLGQHIIHALEKYDIATLFVHEPEFELFYCSLFILPWDQILTIFINDPDRHCSISFDQTAESFKTEKALLEDQHPFYFRANARLSGNRQQDYGELIQLENDYDSLRYNIHSAGWYEDQVMGLKNALRNVCRGLKFYRGKQIKPFTRVFLIGSGPSLNESIDYLKQHQQDAILIACGSAISVLIKNGINPDIHILQERTWTRDIMLKYASEEIYSKIIALKLNTVESSLDGLYREVYVFQKAKDPGSCLLDTDTFPVSYAVNPTVTNAGASFSVSLGADEIYLFGIDYGTRPEDEFMHAEGTVVNHADEVDHDSPYLLKGNFSDHVISDEIFSWSHNVAELLVAQNRNIKWFNVGDGAAIKHAKKLRSSELPQQFRPMAFDKNRFADLLAACFSNEYSIEETANRLNNLHLQSSYDYLNAILDCFESTPNSRRGIITNITLISRAANSGVSEESYLPQKLFGGEIQRYLENVYSQVAVTQNDDQAVVFYSKAADILREHAEAVFEDFQLTVARILEQELASQQPSH